MNKIIRATLAGGQDCLFMGVYTNYLPMALLISKAR